MFNCFHLNKSANIKIIKYPNVKTWSSSKKHQSEVILRSGRQKEVKEKPGFWVRWNACLVAFISISLPTSTL